MLGASLTCEEAVRSCGHGVRHGSRHRPASTGRAARRPSPGAGTIACHQAAPVPAPSGLRVSRASTAVAMTTLQEQPDRLRIRRRPTMRRDIGTVGLLFASVGSIIGSGWLFGALNAVADSPARRRSSRG